VEFNIVMFVRRLERGDERREEKEGWEEMERGREEMKAYSELMK
jgi:hypothetical protein